MTFVFSPQCTANTSPTSQSDSAAIGVIFPVVYTECEMPPTALSDAARESAILRAGKSVKHHMAENKKFLLDFDISSNFVDKDLANRHRLMAEEAARLMAALIRGRTNQGAKA